MNTEILNKPAAEMTEAELEQLLNAKKEANRQANLKKKESYLALRNATVEELIPMASALSNELRDFADLCFSNLNALYALLKDYSKRHENGKGNFEIVNEKGDMKIRFKANETWAFDERSQQAEKHIIDFVQTQFTGDAKTQKLITNLLERSKGKLDIKLVQKLYAMEDDYEDQNWREGIKLLKESWVQGRTRYYVQFECLIDGTWKPIIMDFAALCNRD